MAGWAGGPRAGRAFAGPVRCALVLILPLVFVSCDRGGTGASALTPLPAALEFERTVRIDGYTEDLVPVGFTASTPDGGIVLAQNQDGKVLIYDSTGARVAEFGRQGEGPGEFQGLSFMGWVGDTLWLNDARQRRTTWVAVDPEPRLLRTESWGAIQPTTELPGIPGFRNAWPWGFYADGTVLARLSGPVGDPPELEGEQFVGRVTLDGELLGIVARYRDPDNSVSREDRQGGRIVRSFALSNPWTIGTQMSVPGRGDETVFVFTDIHPDHTVSLRVQRMAGLDTAWVRELRFAGIPITREMADSAIEARAAAISDDFASSWDGLDIRDVYRSEATVPPVLPPVQNVYAGPDGTLWIRTGWIEGLPAGTHLVLDASGDLLGHIPVEDGTVTQVGADHAWLTVTDSMGVESVVRGRVLPPPE